MGMILYKITRREFLKKSFKLGLFFAVSSNILFNIVACAKEKQTLDIETYRNSKYGFSLKYPKGWDILEDYRGCVAYFAGPYVNIGDDKTYLVNITIKVIQLPEKITLKDVVRGGDLEDKRRIPDYKKLNEYSTTIGGLPAIVQIISGTSNIGEGRQLKYKDVGARVIKDNSLYMMLLDIPTKYHDEYLECFELVINSFKF